MIIEITDEEAGYLENHQVPLTVIGKVKAGGLDFGGACVAFSRLQRKTHPELEAYALAANEKKARDGEVEIDSYAGGEALVSKGEDDGAYVMAWVWVEDAEAGVSTEEEEEEPA